MLMEEPKGCDHASHFSLGSLSFFRRFARKSVYCTSLSVRERSERSKRVYRAVTHINLEVAVCGTLWEFTGRSPSTA